MLPVVLPPGISTLVVLLSASFLVATTLASNTSQPKYPINEGSFSVTALLPVGFLSLALTLVSATTLSALISVEFLKSRWFAWALWTVVVTGWTVAGLLRGGRIRVIRGDVESTVVGGLVLALGAAMAAMQPFAIWSRAVATSTDFNRHLILMKQLLANGGLDYGAESYPRGFHSTVGIVWSATGGTGFAEAWQSMQSVSWLLLVLIALSMAVVVARSLEVLSLPGRGLQVFGCLTVLVIFMQSMWVTSVFRMGFVTSLLAGLVLATTLMLGIGNRGRWFGSPWSFAWAAVGSALLAHTWTLLMPTLMLVGLASFVTSVRRSGWAQFFTKQWLGPIAIAGGAILVSIPPLIAISAASGTDGELNASLSMAGNSGLQLPAEWWYIAVALAILSLFLFWRVDALPFSVQIATLLVAGVISVVVVASAGTTPSGYLNYYALKTLWSFSVVVTPLAIVAVLWLIVRSVGFIRSRPAGLSRAAPALLLVTLLVVLGAGIAGRVSGTPSALIDGARNGFGIIPFQLPIVTELETRGIDFEEQDQPVIVWGVVPNATALSLNTFNVQFADQTALESTGWLGAQGLGGNPMSRAIYGRDVETACEYLRRNPDALRVTGANPAAGGPWLVDAGCPTEVVMPEVWISVPIDDAWLAGTDLATKPYQYPSYAEFEAEYERRHRM